MITLAQRIGGFNERYAHYPASCLHVVNEQGRDVLYGHWLIGNDYRNPSSYYGSYPAGYLDRMGALFSDIPASDTLHVFSGSLPPADYTRLDWHAHNHPDIVGSVYETLTLTGRRWPLIYADPPYSEDDAVIYGTLMVDRKRAIHALAEAAEPGAYLVWLDVQWPMHKKSEWLTVGRICLIRSTNHRVRLVSIFQRQ